MNVAAKIDEESLSRLVPLFYDRVRQDPELAPIFNDAIANWPEHLEKLVSFWSSVMLTSGRYRGNPVAKHLAVEGITMELFERWLALFNETCGELFDERLAREFGAKAARIAESLKLALFYRPDRPWPPQPQA